MENQIAINIKYYAFGDGSGGHYNIEQINDFRAKIHDDYISSFHIHTAECGGGNFFIEFIYNLTLSDFLSFIVGGLAWDGIKSGVKKYAIDNFIKLYKKFREKDEISEIRDVTFLFNDTRVEFYSIMNRNVEVDFSLIGELYNTLALKYQKLINSEGKYPTEICIPIFFDDFSLKFPVYRMKLEVDEPLYFEKEKQFDKDDYWKFWGLKYEDYTRAVYDVANDNYIKTNWMTEDEYLRED